MIPDLFNNLRVTSPCRATGHAPLRHPAKRGKDTAKTLSTIVTFNPKAKGSYLGLKTRVRVSPYILHLICTSLDSQINKKEYIS